jgi:hypothetical protein
VPRFAARKSQVFTRFVEIGRVALINYGPLEGKLCTIIDVVDEKRVRVSLGLFCFAPGSFPARFYARVGRVLECGTSFAVLLVEKVRRFDGFDCCVCWFGLGRFAFDSAGVG